MTKNAIGHLLLIILIVFTLSSSTCEEKPQQDNTEEPSFPVLTGLYLGQTPPGLIPVRFPPPVLQANEDWFWHGSPCFSPDGQEMYFVKMLQLPNGQRLEINTMKIENGRWTEPQRPSFASAQYDENNPQFSIDGNTLYFMSSRPGGDIFRVTRQGAGWSDPTPVNIPIPAGFTRGWQFCITRNGTIYLELWGPNSAPPDLYRTRLVNGQYGSPENLGTGINTPDNEFAPYVDPDEEYIVFTSNRPGGRGRNDLYISFRAPGDTWSTPISLGDDINSASEDSSPYVTPDGLYFFFTTDSPSAPGYEPYWVSAEVIHIFGNSARK